MTSRLVGPPPLRAAASAPLVQALPAHADGALLGGKGASLDALVRHGLPVPVTSVITTAAYRRVAAEPSLAGLLARLRAEPLPAAAGLAAAAREVDDAFLAVPLPTELELELVEQTRPVWQGRAVAVRSSATTEDLHGASFAGQYRSFLGVHGPQELLRAVRLTWASLWHPSPRGYRRFRGIGEEDVAMAVIVMAMVDAELSGVAFTTDPGGSPDALRVEVVHGLAEKLVAGQVTPGVLVAPRRPPRDAPPVLDEVAELALRVEAMSNDEPQDVEWAYDGRRVWLVQARPITVPADADDADDGFDSRLADDDVTTTAGIAEMLPGVLPSLLWEVAGGLLEEALRRTFDDLGALPPELPASGRFLRRVRGRAGLDLRVLTAVAGRLPGTSAEDVEQQYFGSTGDGTAAPGGAPAPRRGRLRELSPGRLRQDARVLRIRGRATLEGDVVATAVAEVLDRRPAVTGLPTDALLSYRTRLLDLGGRAMAAEVAVASAAVAAYAQLEAVLSRTLGTEAGARWAQELTAHAGADAVRRRTQPLLELGEPVRDVVAGGDDWATAHGRLATSEEGRELLRRLDDAWQRAGSTSVLAGPTWAEAPALAWGWVRSPAVRPAEDGAGTAPGPALDHCIRLLQSSPGWQRRRILTGQLVDVRASMVRRAAGEAVGLLGRRERVKAAVLELGGEVRRAHLELGARLVVAGRLETAADVDHLTSTELRAALGGGGPTLETVARRRRWVEQMAAAPAPPPLFSGVPPPPRAVERSGTRFVGWGASPGACTGRVRVVTSPGTAELIRGEVLVARTTDASWAPLFLLAGAIVVEEGGPLSHASILARELRLPAVLNLPGVVDRLREAEGRLVTVDGGSGVVVLHEPDPAAPVDEPSR